MLNIKQYHRATTLDEAYAMLTSQPANAVIGGGAWMKSTKVNIDTLIDLCDLKLDRISETTTEIIIGAMSTLRMIETHPAVQKLADGILSKAASLILGVPFRHLATIGGSVMGRYAFSDMITALSVLDVTLDFHHAGNMSLQEHMTRRGKMNDILLAIRVNKQTGKGYFKKVSNTVLDFAILNIAVHHVDGRFWIALGARPGASILAEEAMKLINTTKQVDEAAIEATASKVVETVSFGSSHLASADYRQALAKTYVSRGIKEVLSL